MKFKEGGDIARLKKSFLIKYSPMKPEDLKSPFKWDARRVLIQDKVWFVPNYYDQYDKFTFPGWEHPDLFGNSNSVFVEYCSGNGAWITAKAEENPHLNWVAVEKQFVRARKIWSKIKNLNLHNLVVICGEAQIVTSHYFPENSISSVYINFPDPWPKARHAKHRILQPAFVEQISRILQKEGSLELVTDDADFSSWSIDILKQNPDFSSDHAFPYYRTDFNGYGSSFFEQLWRQKGRVIRHHLFRKQNSARSDGIDSISISINARVNSDLDWKAAKEEALDAVKKKKKILWKLDFGLFSELQNSELNHSLVQESPPQKLMLLNSVPNSSTDPLSTLSTNPSTNLSINPLTNQTLFLSLSLALEHFRDTLWKEFETHTSSVSLYEGKVDFSQDFMWSREQTENFQLWLQDRFETIECLNQELGMQVNSFSEVLPKQFQETILPVFCRDVVAEYFFLLTHRMPDAMPLSVELDASSASPLLQVQLLNREIFGRIELKIKGSLLFSHGLCQSAICLPSIKKCRPSDYEKMEVVLDYLLENKIPFKVIPEEKLITEWDGLDYIFYNPSALTYQGKRKLQGFCAAGGTVISVKDKMGFAQESLLEEWMIKKNDLDSH